MHLDHRTRSNRPFPWTNFQLVQVEASAAKFEKKSI